LIVDDNADLRLMLKVALESAGYAVQVAADGREALRLQREDPADVVITDLFMPETDGFETIQSLRADYPHTRIVVMSGDSQRVRQDYLSSAELMGVQATLRKPVDVELLLQMLRRL
jgi:CheY-like chemotaxis protein